jgi:transcriptional regulator with XRE-family HTH domain
MTQKEQSIRAAKRERQKATRALGPPEKLFGLELFRLRDSQKLTIRQAAKKAGIHFSTLNNVEKGSRLPSVELTLKLAELYQGKKGVEPGIELARHLLALLRQSQNAVLAQQHQETLHEWAEGRRAAAFAEQHRQEVLPLGTR